MKIHIISIFPESFESHFSTSIIGRAKEKGLFDLVLYKLNDFSEDKNKRVDDKAYGMHGQVLSPKPLGKAIEFIFNKIGGKVPVVYMSPSGDLLTQKKVEEYYEKLEGEFIIICGHYEGIDQRIIDLYVDYCVSIGEYIISSGELAASVFIDSLLRHFPGVLGKIESLEEDSFSEKFNRQKEYPVYTRPKEYNGIKVPDVLISGDHGSINKWKSDNLY